MKASILALVVLMLVTGCKWGEVRPPVGDLKKEGFDAFATPRSFDGPGTVYRIDNDGKRFTVAEISIKESGGDEEIPAATSSEVFSTDQLLKDLGIAAAAIPASAQAHLDNTTTVNLSATTATRKFTTDRDVDAAMATYAFNVRPDDGSVYYLIRETIATKQLTYKVEQKWLASLNLDVQKLNAAGYTGAIKKTSDDTLEMNKNFGKELNVWYKAEKITLKKALGGGPGQYTVEKQPVRGSEIGL